MKSNRHFKEFISSAAKELRIKKIIIILILLACAVLLISQRNNFLISKVNFNDVNQYKLSDDQIAQITQKPLIAKNDYERYASGIPSEKRISLKGNNVITETFTAKENKLKRVILYFYNPEGYTTDGRVYINILDSKGKSVCDSALNVKLIANDSATRFDFDGSTALNNSNKIVSKREFTSTADKGISVEKGSKYTIKITTKNVKAISGFGIYICDGKYSNSSTLNVNGSNMGSQRLFAGVSFLHFNIFVFMMFMLVLIIAILIVLLPFKMLGEIFAEHRKRKNKKIIELDVLLQRIIFIAAPFVSFYLLRKIAGDRTSEAVFALFTKLGMINLLLIILVEALFYLIINRTRVASILTVFFTFIYGFANYALIQFRDCPLMATDFGSIGTAKDVAASYTLILGKSCLWAIVITTTFCCITAAIGSHKGLNWKKRIVLLLVFSVCSTASIGVLTNKQYILNNKYYVSGFNPTWSYGQLGYYYSFLLTVNDAHAKKPKGYSVAKVKDITEKYKSDSAKSVKKATTTSPNIIAIMNESFSDVKVDGDFKTSADYMPFVHSLKKNTIKGIMHTSVFGGGTADTEFEFLTGNSMFFLPYKSIPYNNRIKSKSPSLTQSLKKEGYIGNIAFHPGMATSYNRNKAYPLLGFSKFISLSDLNHPEYLRSYVSDKYDFETIIKEYKKSKSEGSETEAPFYMFNVTIQNHASYKLTEGVVEKQVSITNDSVRQEEAEQYLNLIKKSDEAFEELVNYFKTVKEPTVIVMFGDHQPRLETEFYNAISSKLTGLTSQEKTEKKYQVPIIIWANYDIGEVNNLDISANYLSPYLSKVTHQSLTGYDKYLLNLRKKVPVITKICYKGSNGKLYSSNDKSEYSKYIKQYEMIQYNNLIDSKNRINDFFYLK